MSDFVLHMEQGREDTPVSNIFIDEYMPAANGAYVKIYLYLLRCMHSGAQSLSVPAIADRFDHTENDVHRALAYWEKMKLLRLEYNASQALSGICLLEPQPQTGEFFRSATKDPARSASPTQPLSAPSPSTPPKPDYSPDQLLKFQQEDELRQLLFITEQYLGKTLSPTEISSILYFYDSLHFSAELIEYLIEYCVTKGHRSMRYIESVAQAWHKEGYTTPTEAKKATDGYGKQYFTVLKAFGIKGRSPVESEVRFIDHWTRELGFTQDLILEACDRTIAAIHQPSFKYADSILESWHKQKIRSLNDLKSLDERRAQDAQNSRSGQKSVESGPHPAASAQGSGAPSQPSGASAVKKASASNRFHNFNQRDYDFSALEKQLINH